MYKTLISGEPKKKKRRNDFFTVYFRYGGIFVSDPFKYAQGDMKELYDINFDEMTYENLLQIVTRLVPYGQFEKVYYCKTGDNLSVGLREIKSDQDIVDMLKVGYENGNMIDMYVEHIGYDIMELCELEKNAEKNENVIDSSDDSYLSSDDNYCEEIDCVDFQTEGDESVSIKNISTQDLFLNKLCSSRIFWSDKGECRRPGINETPIAWAVVRVENHENWGWFVHLLSEDL